MIIGTIKSFEKEITIGHCVESAISTITLLCALYSIAGENITERISLAGKEISGVIILQQIFSPF